MRRALAFLTPLGGGSSPPRPETLRWFPLVGALIGLAVGGVWLVAGELWPPAVAAGLALAMDLALTGMLHVDGLVDTADGLLPPLEQERRLEVMADPRAGAFGVVAVVVVLLLRWVALASQRVSVPLVGGLWCASRTVMAVTVSRVPYARPGGLAAAFGPGKGGRQPAPALLAGGLVLAVVLVAVGRGGVGVVCLAATLVGAAAVVRLAVRRVGGFTGDVLGAAGVVGETAGLVLAAARW